MKKLFLLCAAVGTVLVSIVPVLAWVNQPPTNADFKFGSSAQASNVFTSGGGVDLPDPGEAQDAAAELEGSICNDFSGKSRRIDGITCWLEGPSRKVLTSPSGGPLVEGIKMSASAGGALMTANSAGSSGGTQAFDLDHEISASACGNYSMQIGHIVNPPNRFTVAMTTSSLKADVVRHYDNMGEHNFTALAHTKIFDAQPRSVRTGVTFDVHNFDNDEAITGVRIALITNGSVTMTGCAVDDMVTGLPVAGATVSIDGDGLGITVSGLSQTNPGGVMVWVDTTDPINDPSTFRVRATFTN